MIRTSITGIGFACLLPVAAMADYVLTLTETGLREYYCTITVELKNTGSEPLTEVSGHFLSFVGDERVGRSKGASFLNVEPNTHVAVTFDTPNAPCDDVTRYDFVVGACRPDMSFEDKSLCAARIIGTDPISGASGS